MEDFVTGHNGVLLRALGMMKGYSVSTNKSKECRGVTNHRLVTIGDIIDITTDLLFAGCQLR